MRKTSLFLSSLSSSSLCSSDLNLCRSRCYQHVRWRDGLQHVEEISVRDKNALLKYWVCFPPLFILSPGWTSSSGDKPLLPPPPLTLFKTSVLTSSSPSTLSAEGFSVWSRLEDLWGIPSAQGLLCRGGARPAASGMAHGGWWPNEEVGCCSRKGWEYRKLAAGKAGGLWGCKGALRESWSRPAWVSQDASGGG